MSAVRSGPSHAFIEMLDSVPGAWFFTRRDGSFAYVSLGACEALGYSRSELLGLRVFDIDPMMNADAWAKHWETTVPSQSRTFRTRHRRQDGSEYPIEIRSLKIELNGEQLSASYSVDLTASERAHAALAATESRLQRLLENLPDLVFGLRLGERLSFEFVSPSCQVLLGYAPAELVDDPSVIARILHAEDHEAFAALRHAAPHASGRFRFVHRAGNVVWMEVRATLVPGSGEQPPGLEGVARDVTQSHQAELAKRRLLAAIEQAAEAVVVTDAGGKVEYVNPAYQQTSGIAAEHALGRPWKELEVRRDRAFLRRFRRVLERGEVWQGRIQSVRACGGSYDEDATVAPIRDDSGQQAGCVAVKRDITEQLALEEQLHQAQKMEAVGRLASGIAHDFNNLLHVIQGHTRMLQGMSWASPAAPAEALEMLAEVDKAAGRAASLVRQLLTFSHADAQFVELRLDEVYNALHGSLQSLMGRQIQLIYTCNTGPVVVFGDAAQLKQVVINLCVNARDAMPPGGYLRVALDVISRDALPLAFRWGAEEAYVRLTVRDDGAGMTREVQRHLYEPFFTTKPLREGTGLGLATVYAIVQAHHGFIDSSSTRGQGSTFSVYLPLRSAGPRLGSPASAPGRVDGRGRLAVVAQAEPNSLALVSGYLAEVGFEVLPVCGALEAERLLRDGERDVALIVLDAAVPGLELGRLEAPKLSAAVLSAAVLLVASREYRLAPARREGRLSILRTPFALDELSRHVHRLMGDLP